MIVQACLNGSRAIGFHHRLPLTSEDIANEGASCIAAGAAELHLHPRGATGKESLAAVDSTILSLRRACPGTLIGVSTGAWIENDEVHTRNCIAQWNELPDYASVNLSERDAPGVIELLRRRGIGVEAGLASVADAERLVNLPGHRPVLRILIEIEEQDLGVARQVAATGTRPSRFAATHPAARRRCDSMALCRACASATLVDTGRVGGRQASPGRNNSIRQCHACDRRIGDVPRLTAMCA